MMTLVETKMKVEMKTITMVRVIVVMLMRRVMVKITMVKESFFFVWPSYFFFTNIPCQLSFVPTSSFMHYNVKMVIEV